MKNARAASTSLDIQQGSETDARGRSKSSIDKLIDVFLADDDGIKLALDVVDTMTYSITNLQQSLTMKIMSLSLFTNTETKGTREKAYH